MVYQEIAQNKRNTLLLIASFSVLIVAIGWVFGAYVGDANAGIIIAAVFSTIFTLFGYYKGDSVALAVSGAKKIKKQDSPELYMLVENLAIATGLPTPAIYLIDDAAPNALATGRNPEHASVAVTSGLLKIMEKTELEGVLAHELSHIKNYDIRVMTLVVVLVGVIMMMSDWMMRTFLHGRRREGNSGQAALILFIIGAALAIISPLLAEIIKLAVSRSREYLADASSALLTRYPEGLARALEKISNDPNNLKASSDATNHLYIASPFRGRESISWFHKLFMTHPPIEERIKALRELKV